MIVEFEGKVDLGLNIMETAIFLMLRFYSTSLIIDLLIIDLLIIHVFV